MSVNGRSSIEDLPPTVEGILGLRRDHTETDILRSFITADVMPSIQAKAYHFKLFKMYYRMSVKLFN